MKELTSDTLKRLRHEMWRLEYLIEDGKATLAERTRYFVVVDEVIFLEEELAS